ncbi:MAG: hypothetical protein IPG96_12240 [Proteobacteria bacterium]|nr:hypothetical protein [Pseudomonadota bacterium]
MSAPAPRGSCLRRSCAAGVGALLVALLAFPALAGDGDATQTIYRYRNPAGRTVYVNDLARVPAAQRPRARAVDLSRISLNEALGNDLQRAASQQVAALLGSRYCTGARRGAARGWWGTLWHVHGHLVLIGGALLLLLLGSPWLVRTLGVPQWSKLLLLALPALAFVALLSSSAVRASRTLRAARCRRRLSARALRRDRGARPCRSRPARASDLRARTAGAGRWRRARGGHRRHPVRQPLTRP